MSSLLRLSLILCITMSTALAGTFGQTQQLFAQYGVGGPAETAFTIHDPGNSAITVLVELIQSDGSLFQMEEVAVEAGAAETVVFSDPKGEVKNGWEWAHRWRNFWGCRAFCGCTF